MIDFAAFASALAANPILIFVMVLVIGMLVVNGATNAANAIAAAIGTRSIGPKAAIALGAVCNFVGLVAVTLLSSAVADTIGHIVDFGDDRTSALPALAAAMLAIVIWGIVAWRFGIPTSQTHSLVAGLTGAALAAQGGLAGVNFDQWAKVLVGLLISSALGFVLGWLLSKATPSCFGHMERSKANRVFGPANVVAAAFLACMHGAQDGQKFMSVAVLGIALALGMEGVWGNYPFWILVFCALCLAVGSGIGGKRIIKKTAMDMVNLEKYQGFAASLAASLCLLLATCTGIPVSTTHTKTTAMMGVGAAKRLRSVKWGVAGNMILVWVLTFPCCGVLGWLCAQLFMCML